MFLLGASNSVVSDALFYVMSWTIDWVFFGLLSIVFDSFFVVAKLDLFGSTQLGQQLYESLTQRVYMIMSIVMVFIFAYNLLLYVMQPDGRYVKDNMKPATVLKRIVFSVVLLVMMPLIFRYMSTFQNHVLISDAIPSIILGKEQGRSRVMSKGKRIAIMTWTTFYHPYDSTTQTIKVYGDFINDPDAETCEDYFVKEDALSTNVEKNFLKGLLQNCNSNAAFNTHAFSFSGKDVKDSKIEGLYFASSIGAIIFIIFGIGYIYSIAGRIFRLFALQIFSPVPIMMRIFNIENFKTWFKDLIGTYLDLFIRVAVITFVLFMCSILPDIINAINTAVLNEILLG